MTKEALEKYTVDFMNNETKIGGSRIDSILGKMLIKYAEVFQKRIAELEKENAELKMPCNSCHLSLPQSLIDKNKKLQDKLTKAKEILRKLMKNQPTPSSMYEEADLVDWREANKEAEHFISDDFQEDFPF